MRREPACAGCGPLWWAVPHQLPAESERGVIPRLPTVSRETFETLDTESATALLRCRFEALSDAGCTTEDAILVAVHPEVGLEDALVLLGRGCPGRTALRILL